MAVHGIVQRDPESDVIHVVARRLEDDSHMLRHLATNRCPRRSARAMLRAAGELPPRVIRATSKPSRKAAISTEQRSSAAQAEGAISAAMQH